MDKIIRLEAFVGKSSDTEQQKQFGIKNETVNIYKTTQNIITVRWYEDDDDDNMNNNNNNNPIHRPRKSAKW